MYISKEKSSIEEINTENVYKGKILGDLGEQFGSMDKIPDEVLSQAGYQRRPIEGGWTIVNLQKENIRQPQI